MSPMSPAALLMDYGGVLTERMDLVNARFCAGLGIDSEAFGQILAEWAARPDLDSPSHALERGELSVAAFEELLAARLRRPDSAPVRAEGLVRRMFAETEWDEQTFALVAEIRARGVRTALVSNAWGTDYPLERLRSCFDELVFSNQVRLRKPDPRIYLYASRALGVPPSRCLFVDDRAANVAGAIEAGMSALHFADPSTGRQRLRELFAGLSMNRP
ncbi:HAD family phosphatase [Streptosporangiaceae bacterium NEAU-GS5]|nr:HAD family phosphatase [Streptosporangiaceae bacterium NEAU-GS5]